MHLILYSVQYKEKNRNKLLIIILLLFDWKDEIILFRDHF